MKRPNVAGSFYPQDKGELSRLIAVYMSQTNDVAETKGEPLVLISPHAGYPFSGPVAAYGYRALRGREFSTVVILGPSHYFPFNGAAVYPSGAFRTPLGDLEIDAALASQLIRTNDLFFADPAVFDQEHSIEVQLPFLQTTLKPGVKIVPVLIGHISYSQAEEMASTLAGVLKDKSVLVIASTDLSHYKAYEEASALDKASVDFMQRLDAKGLWDAVADTGWNVCGSRPAAVCLLYASLSGADNAAVLKVANSGDTAGDKKRVVGYASILISRIKKPSEEKSGANAMLTNDDKKRLLEIARQTVASVAAGREVPRFAEKSPGLSLKRGVFVTLRKGDNLRGCIGLFGSDEPLYRTVPQMARSACRDDYRFSPVVPSEVPQIDIEISVLTQPQMIDDWRKIRLGVDGVIVRRGSSSGVFLPQVATETGWDLTTFLGELCSQKAGLPPDSYTDPQTKIFTFQADVFSEREFR